MKLHFLPKFISIFQNFKVGNANDEKRGLFSHSEQGVRVFLLSTVREKRKVEKLGVCVFLLFTVTPKIIKIYIQGYSNLDCGVHNRPIFAYNTVKIRLFQSYKVLWMLLTRSVTCLYHVQQQPPFKSVPPPFNTIQLSLIHLF